MSSNSPFPRLSAREKSFLATLKASKYEKIKNGKKMEKMKDIKDFIFHRKHLVRDRKVEG